MLVRSTRVVLFLMTSALMLFASPTVAAAAWSSPTPELSVVLGYGASYAGGTHRGADLRAEVGDVICTPVEGTVSFSGKVPADGGGTCQAVTIETADGLRVSLLPLTESWVSPGTSVRAGEQVGACAAQGDSSSATTHIHLSLRRGETYLDPTGLLPASHAAPPTSDALSVPTCGDVQPPPAAMTAATSSAAEAPAAMVPTPTTQPAASVLAEPVAASPRSVRMPRDAREARPMMLHSAPVPGLRRLRMPSSTATPSAIVAALAFVVMATLLAVRILPRHVLDRT